MAQEIKTIAPTTASSETSSSSSNGRIVWPIPTTIARYFTYYIKNVGDGNKFLCLEEHDNPEDENDERDLDGKKIMRLVLKRDDPKRDKLLVERVNKHHNDVLCRSLQSGIDITLIPTGKNHYYSDDFTGNPGFLFQTGHDDCKGWLANMTQCHCNRQVYLNTDSIDFSDITIFSLDSVVPLGEVRAIGT